VRSPLPKILPLLALLTALVAPSVAAAEETPLPESDYAVRRACSEPPPGFASCLALQLVPLTREAKRHTHPLGMARRAGGARPHVPSPKSGAFGLRPQDLHSAYGLPATAPSAQTIAIVDAYNDPNAEADLKSYSEEFGLPLCTKANGCFSQVSQKAGAPLPFPETTAELEALWESPLKEEKEEAEEIAGWGTEISLDIETAHATCQSCHILLVEANNPANENLIAAETRAETLGATVISNSWGTSEGFIEPSSDQHAPFNDPGIVITASAGDDGFRNWAAPRAGERNVTSYPASSPHVVSVGGTRLASLIGGTWQGETVWNGSGAGGGGCSVVFTAPAWQQQAADWGAVGCASKRSVADVSADADPYTGVAVRDTDAPHRLCETKYEEEEELHTVAGWCTYGGTSLASPIVASTFALAGGANNVAQPAQTLYSNLRSTPSRFHDVTVGSNGKCASFDFETGLSNCTQAEEAAASCSSTLACQAAPGYDGPTGVGTPNGVLGFEPNGAPSEPAPPPSEARFVIVPNVTSSSPTVAPTPQPPVLTGLVLTAPAVNAVLWRHRPRRSQIAFSFLLTLPANVRATLVRRVRSHGRTRWVAVGATITLDAHGGRTVKRLSGNHRLSPGFYRLTVTVAGGKTQFIAFNVH